jgi:hypothetical protein
MRPLAATVAISIVLAAPASAAGTSTTQASSHPIGNLDAVARVPGGVELNGWAIDPDTSAPISVHVYVGSEFRAVSADVSRPDVAAAFPGYGRNHGFGVTIPMAQGSYPVCVYAINVGAGSPYSVLGCRTLVVSHTPFGNVDMVRRVPGGIEASGWTIDPDEAAPTDMDVYVDGGFAGRYPAGQSRPDVAAAYPGYGAQHGFFVSVPAITGRVSTVCFFAIGRGPGAVNPALACLAVDLTGTPVGSVDWAQGISSGSMIISGWAMDPDTADAIDIHVYVDGAWYGATAATVARPDVGAAYPANGANHGFHLLVSSLRSQHVCVFAINRVGAGQNVLLGCRIDPTTGRPPPPGAPVAPFRGSIRSVTPADYGNAWRPGCPVGPESLSHVTVSFWGFDGQYHEGGLVVHWTWAYHVAWVFGSLYDQRFQLERVEPITYYAGPGDVTPDRLNITSAFICRPVTGGSGWSEHSYGLALDINPAQNPYVNGGFVVPDPEGRDYLDRGQVAPAMVSGGVVQAFAAIGWSWGGHWQTLKDYMHFSLRNR